MRPSSVIHFLFYLWSKHSNFATFNDMGKSSRAVLADLFETRTMHITDLPEVVSLYKAQNGHMGVPSGDYYSEEFYEKLVSEYLNESNNRKTLIGAFHMNRLVLAMGIFFWDTMPNCTFLRFAGLPEGLHGKEFVWAFRSLFSTALDEIENRGFNRFYILSSERHHKSLAKVGGTWGRFRARYFMTVEEVVPANCRPQFQYVWSMMGKKEWPVPVIVRSGTLLNKYRKFDRNIVSVDALKIWDSAGQDSI